MKLLVEQLLVLILAILCVVNGTNPADETGSDLDREGSGWLGNCEGDCDSDSDVSIAQSCLLSKCARNMMLSFALFKVRGTLGLLPKE